MNAITVAAALALLALAGPPVTAETGLARAVDGDTIVVARTHLGLWGIDAPESEQTCKREGADYACGREATAHLRWMVGHKNASCESRTKDRYGRTVTVCRADGIDLGAAMVRDGWATAFTRYSADYVGEDLHAQEARRGMWGGSFMLPWEWRTTHRHSSD